MYFSLQERKKRELKRYRKKLKSYEELDADEIELKYMNAKSAYEHKKIVLSALMVSIVLSVIMDMWKRFFELTGKILQYYASNLGSNEIAKATFVVYMVFIVFVTLIVFSILIYNVKELRMLHKDLIIIEKIRH